VNAAQAPAVKASVAPSRSLVSRTSTLPWPATLASKHSLLGPPL
jgi:hypothetical protein